MIESRHQFQLQGNCGLRTNIHLALSWPLKFHSGFTHDLFPRRERIMASNHLFELSPLDHIIARIYTSYILHFDTDDTDAAVRAIENGVRRLASHVPFLAGDVTLSKPPESPKNRARVSLSPLSVDQVPMLNVRHHSEHPDQGFPHEALHPLPPFLPFSSPSPVLRFQANPFQNARVILVMSFHHHIIDGSGAEQVLKALAECCRAADDQTDLSLPRTIADNEPALGARVSAWPKQCTTRVDHTNDFGPDILGVDISAEQFAELEAAMSAAVKTKRFSFSSEKIRQVKDLCNQLGSSSSKPSSSNDVFTALLALSIDQAQNQTQAEGRSLDAEKEAHVMMIVDMRSRIQPPLPNTYLGNMILPVRTDLYHSGPIASETPEYKHLAQVARTSAGIRAKLSSMNETDVYSVASMISEQDDWAATGGRPANAFFTSWRHLGVYEFDFGSALGHMANMDTDPGLMAGVCTVLPPRDKTTAPWEIKITMKPDAFERFEKDPLVRRIL